MDVSCGIDRCRWNFYRYRLYHVKISLDLLDLRKVMVVPFTNHHLYDSEIYWNRAFCKWNLWISMDRGELKWSAREECAWMMMICVHGSNKWLLDIDANRLMFITFLFTFSRSNLCHREGLSTQPFSDCFEQSDFFCRIYCMRWAVRWEAVVTISVQKKWFLDGRRHDLRGNFTSNVECRRVCYFWWWCSCDFTSTD